MALKITFLILAFSSMVLCSNVGSRVEKGILDTFTGGSSDTSNNENQGSGLDSSSSRDSPSENGNSGIGGIASGFGGGLVSGFGGGLASGIGSGIGKGVSSAVSNGIEGAIDSGAKLATEIPLKIASEITNRVQNAIDKTYKDERDSVADSWNAIKSLLHQNIETGANLTKTVFDLNTIIPKFGKNLITNK